MAGQARHSTESVDAVCRYWNKKDVVKHRVFTEKIKRKVKTILKDYTVDEVCKAIFNYATILHDRNFYWTYRWTLHDFLQRGLERFMDEAHPYENYKSGYPVDPDKPRKEDGNQYKDRFLIWKNASPEERKVLEAQWKGDLKGT